MKSRLPGGTLASAHAVARRARCGPAGRTYLNFGLMARIYLDNAATSWPKPEAVYCAVDGYQRNLGAPAGRGVYTEANETERLVSSCRKRIAIEAGVSGLWSKYVGLDGKIVGIDRFGLSAPGNIAMKELGITAEAVIAAAKSL